MEKLLNLFTRIRPLSSGLESHLSTIIRRFSYRKEEPILQPGQTCRKIAFIQSGLVRWVIFYRGQECTMRLMKERDIFFEPDSFMHQKPSKDGIIAIEDCDILGIGHDHLEETYNKFPEFNYHMRIINQRLICQAERSKRILSRDTPAEKYALLSRVEPDLVRRVPLEYMASYLDIDIETLNDLRSKK